MTTKYYTMCTMALATLITYTYPVGAQVNAANTNTNPADTTTMHNRTTQNLTNDYVNWNEENSYWRDNYASRPYYQKSRDYSTMEPAYRYGMDMYNQYPDRRYDQLDRSELERGWNQTRGDSNLEWNDAEHATRDAYNRLYENRTTRR